MPFSDLVIPKQVFYGRVTTGTGNIADEANYFFQRRTKMCSISIGLNRIKGGLVRKIELVNSIARSPKQVYL